MGSSNQLGGRTARISVFFASRIYVFETTENCSRNRIYSATETY